MKSNRHNWILMLVSAMMICMASTCSTLDDPTNDDEIPPHITPPEEEVEVPVTFKKDTGVTRLVSYNVGAFNKYSNSIDMIAKMMKELDADIVGLNEVDSCTTRTGRVHQAKKLAEKLGNWHYALATLHPYKEGLYGNAIVMSSEFKMEGKKKIQLPRESTSDEVRSCAVIKNEKFIYMATHLEVKRESARLSGAKTITEWAKENYGSSDKPVFLCGDMNCEPSDAPIKELLKDWTLLSVTDNTYPSRSATKCIDYIFVLKNKAQYELVGSAVPLNFQYGSVEEASDHRPVYVDVKLK